MIADKHLTHRFTFSFPLYFSWFLVLLIFLVFLSSPLLHCLGCSGFWSFTRVLIWICWSTESLSSALWKDLKNLLALGCSAVSRGLSWLTETRVWLQDQPEVLLGIYTSWLWEQKTAKKAAGWSQETVILMEVVIKSLLYINFMFFSVHWDLLCTFGKKFYLWAGLNMS